MDDMWDCIIVGGGAAGLSAALVLGRARQRTLLVDAGAQSNLPAEGIRGLLGHDGRRPAELYAAGRRELGAYPTVELVRGEVAAGRRDRGSVDLRLVDGSEHRTRRVLLATGMDYQRPALPGIEQRWGRSVFHCPFCHGWEVRDRNLGVLDPAPTGPQRALLLREWSDEVTLYAGGPASFGEEDAARLRAAGITVEERPVVELRGPGTALRTVCLEGGAERACEGLLVAVTLRQRSGLAAELGVALADPGPLAVDAVRVDPTCHTNVPEVYAAGDAAAAMPSVANAIAAGSVAAAMIVHDLVATGHRSTAAA